MSSNVNSDRTTANPRPSLREKDLAFGNKSRNGAETGLLNTRSLFCLDIFVPRFAAYWAQLRLKGALGEISGVKTDFAGTKSSLWDLRAYF